MLRKDESNSLIQTVARLKELAGLGATPSYATACDEFRYETDVLNAAPALLDVLGGFREGDTSALSEIANLLDEAGYVAKSAYMRRYRDMAQAMEGKE